VDEENSAIARVVRRLRKDYKDTSEKRDRWQGWKRMRTIGVGRAALPFKGASDFHYPMIDTVIEQLKPFYLEQAIGPEPLCSFIPRTSADYADSNIAAQWFDCQLRVWSNFRHQMMINIDYFCELSKSILKHGFDHDKKQLRLEAINPCDLIVPPWTEGLDDAERVAHVIYMSYGQYIRAAKKHGWLLDEDWLRQARGLDEDTSQIKRDKEDIDGITAGDAKDLMILWEVYHRDEDGKWLVDLVSPGVPEKKVKPTIHGIPWADDCLPFVDYNYEVRDRGYFSTRGVCDVIGQWELLACKYINELNDYMTFCNRPVFSNKGASLNAQNFRLNPGAVYNGEITPIQFPEPPVSFDQQLQQIRGIAERRIGMPDYGIGEGNDRNESRTATEVKALGAVQGKSVDLRGRVFRDSLDKTFKLAWKILLFYKRDDYEYYYRNEYKPGKAEALRDAYILEPNGNPDGFNKDSEIRKIIDIINIPQVQPYIKMDQAARMMLELADSRYLKTMWKGEGPDPDQQEEQFDEISNMLNGLAVQVSPTDDDMTHLGSIDQFIAFRTQQQETVPPIPSLLIYDHVEAHINAVKQKSPEIYKENMMQFKHKLAMIQQNRQVIMQALQGGAPGMQVPNTQTEQPMQQPVQGPPAAPPISQVVQ
jgi:hypothetical protein